MEKYDKLSKELASAMEDDNDELILKLLNKVYKLKEGMTYDILKKTKIGKNVGINRKRGGKIARLSTEIVDSWRHLATGHKRPAEEENKVKETKEEAELPKKTSTPPPKKVKRGPETLNELTTRLIKKYLEPKGENDTKDPNEVAEEFGKLLEEKYKGNEKDGRDTLTVYIQSLNDKDHEMRDNIMMGEWLPEDIVEGLVDITPTWILKEKEKEDRELSDRLFIREADLNQETDTLECPKCHGFKAKYYEKQTRSADEPMTIFARCMLCGKRWRKY